jgi:hypothetical protein
MSRVEKLKAISEDRKVAVDELTAQRSTLLQQILNVAYRADKQTDEIKAKRRNMRVVSNVVFSSMM